VTATSTIKDAPARRASLWRSYKSWLVASFTVVVAVWSFVSGVLTFHAPWPREKIIVNLHGLSVEPRRSGDLDLLVSMTVANGGNRPAKLRSMVLATSVANDQIRMIEPWRQIGPIDLPVGAIVPLELEFSNHSGDFVDSKEQYARLVLGIQALDHSGEVHHLEEDLGVLGLGSAGIEIGDGGHPYPRRLTLLHGDRDRGLGPMSSMVFSMRGRQAADTTR